MQGRGHSCIVAPLSPTPFGATLPREKGEGERAQRPVPNV